MLDKKVVRFSVALLAPLVLTNETILDTGF
jgi:hypothetical protein